MIVDVLRFTTCVLVACARKAVILPYEWKDQEACSYAVRKNAELAGKRNDPESRWSLSPTDLLVIPGGTGLVLPSPNGSALSFRAAAFGTTVIAGSLRNASAVGRALADTLVGGNRVAVIASGERWRQRSSQSTADPLRPAVEDSPLAVIPLSFRRALQLRLSPPLPRRPRT